jgi:hypothetical protein
MKQKGQVALEFLTTYGWAILILMVMIGAIAYFGVINPERFTPARCLGSPEFSCVDYQVLSSTGVVQFQLKQGLGKTIYLNGTTCTYEGTVPISTAATVQSQGSGVSLPAQWSPRDTYTFTCAMATAGMPIASFKGKKIRFNYNLSYQLSATGLQHTADGEIYAEVQ